MGICRAGPSPIPCPVSSGNRTLSSPHPRLSRSLSVDLNLDPEEDAVSHAHTFVVGSVAADCDTCFDSTETKTIPVASYGPGDLRKNRLASVATVTGPSLLRSGAMSTELTLRHGDGRVRVAFQHAPVWEAGVEPGSCPPDGLKLFRTTVCREALGRPGSGPPTASAEAANPPPRGDPRFFRPIPPFFWHKRWAGTSWTWGPTTGDRGWKIEEMDEADSWHGRPTGDHMGVWSMRLPGGILIQCPRVVMGGEAGLCRLAWLPEDDAPVGTGEDGDPARLLRVEASVLALEPAIDEESGDMVGFFPPSLGSLRCDVLSKVGELEDASMLKKLMELDSGGGVVTPRKEGEAPASVPSPPPPQPFPPLADGQSSGTKKKSSTKEGKGNDGDDSGLDAIRKALKF